MQLPLLITGIAGVAGFNALRHFRSLYDGAIVGMRQRNNWPLRGPGIVACDAEDRDGLARLFDRHQFAAVLNCAGNCALKKCELDPAMAARINVEGTQNLLRHAAGRTRLIHLSIDLVYSGLQDRGNDWHGYREDDPTDPVTVYGRTMVEAEQLVLEADPAACVLRISLPMGVSFNGHAGAIDWIQSRFKHARPATLYFDEIRTPMYTDCLNHLLHDVLTNNLAGLYHAGGPRRLTLFEIAQIVNRVGGYDPRHLHGCPRRDAGPMPPRAGNVALDSTKLRNVLGYEPFDPWPSDPALVPTHSDWHRDRANEVAGSPELLARVLYHNPRRQTAPSSSMNCA